ncbi:MAG: hypothetical protein IPO07_14775 [Haliscomenobacter sp.]|nr:hypothetical protein [Haliscomenobacter sp.]MBK9489889.1 hypothetical protein [Haliscomenobacter sp.]
METTLLWRLQQIRQGEVEIRCTPTLAVLESHYAQEDLLSLLEMKMEDAHFDDYRTLISLIK